jgi:Putative peptidoglycan binding domain
MRRFTTLVFCLALLVAIAARTADGQTNAPIVQNGARVAVTRSSHATNVRSNAPVSHSITHGPVSFGPRMINSHPIRIGDQLGMNLRSSYSPFVRPLNPTLAAMSARQSAPTYNVQPITTDILREREMQQTPLPTTNVAQRVDRTSNLQPIPADVTKRETTQHTERWNQQTGRNRFSYSDALRRHPHEWHNRDWWRQHCNTIVFVTGGYYFLDAGYWYPAWGYDPLNSYYDQDGPIYTYGNLLPDEVIGNVQVALQEAGYYAGPATGSLNVETRAALANYQRDQGLLITGAIDQPTIESLGLY